MGENLKRHRWNLYIDTFLNIIASMSWEYEHASKSYSIGSAIFKDFFKISEAAFLIKYWRKRH